MVAYMISDREYNGGIYRWRIGMENAEIIFASTNENLEKPALSDGILKAVRDDYLKRIPSSTVIGEKKTKLDDHPGLISIVQVDSGRFMCWVYLYKNRFYLLTLTLDDNT